MTSGGSYLVSLPKDWVTDNGLEKGSQVRVARLGETAIVVDAKPLERPKPRLVEIDAGEDIGREVTACYLSGFERILVRSGRMITAGQKEAIRAAASRLAGMEVINETSDSILLANLVVPTDLSIEDIMRRMHQIGSSMLLDAIESLVKGDRTLAENVVERDDSLDRLYFLLIRLLKMAVGDILLAEKMGVSPAQCLDLRLAASMMENVGDDSVRICSLPIPRTEGMTNGRLRDLAREVSILYDQAKDALLNGNFGLSNMVIRNRPRISDLISSLGDLPSELLASLEDLAAKVFDIADVVTGSRSSKRPRGEPHRSG